MGDTEEDCRVRPGRRRCERCFNAHGRCVPADCDRTVREILALDAYRQFQHLLDARFQTLTQTETLSNPAYQRLRDQFFPDSTEFPVKEPGLLRFAPPGTQMTSPEPERVGEKRISDIPGRVPDIPAFQEPAPVRLEIGYTATTDRFPYNPPIYISRLFTG